jgi:hypothetical protein
VPLLFDGMGGANGRLPADLMTLTAEQVEAWWLRPMAAVRRASQTPPGAARPTPAELPGPMTLDQFRAAFGAAYPDRPADWWERAHRKWQEEAARGQTAL